MTRRPEGAAMPKTLSTLLAAVLAFGTLGAAAAPGSAAAPPTALGRCSKLTAHTANDRLVNGQFQLQVQDNRVSLDQNLTVPGPQGSAWMTTGVWFRDDGTGLHTARNYTQLALFCNGDLALLTSGNALLWHSGTANKGATRLVLTAAGNLVLLNAAGGVVWQSRTTPVMLRIGQGIASGRGLVNAWVENDRPTVLTMQTDGNLVMRYRTTVLWQSGTHVAGSRAVMSSTGRLVVVSPAGKPLWATRQTGSPYTILQLHPREFIVVDTATNTYLYQTPWRPVP